MNISIHQCSIEIILTLLKEIIFDFNMGAVVAQFGCLPMISLDQNQFEQIPFCVLGQDTILLDQWTLTVCYGQVS